MSNKENKDKKSKTKKIPIIGFITIILVLIICIIVVYVANSKEKKKDLVIKKLLKNIDHISQELLAQTSLLNKNINLFIKQFNKKYKTAFIYTVKLPRETESKKEKYIETTEMIYGMENAVSEITYAIKEGKKENNHPNNRLLNMRRYQSMTEEMVMLDKKIGSLIEEMNKRYKTKFIYKTNMLSTVTHKEINRDDINYISAMSSQIKKYV